MVSTSAASTHFVQFCIQWSSIALLYYDYALTFGMEVQYIWGEKFRISTVLYVCCRYALVANIVYLLTIAHKITGNCHAGYVVSSALSVAGRSAVVSAYSAKIWLKRLNERSSVVWAARTFAVWGKNRWVLLFFGSIGLMIIILDIIQAPKHSCNGSSTVPIVGGLLSIMMSIFEIFSAGFTTFRTVQALNVNGQWWKQKKGFHYLVLEQGILYFCLVTALTISSLALNVALPGGFLQRLLNAYTIPLSGMMTARFLLHLRKWEAKHTMFRSTGANGEEDDGTGTSTNLDFASQHHSRILNSQLNTRSDPETNSVSFMDEFGEDPVRRARAQGRVSIDFGIVEESRA